MLLALLACSSVPRDQPNLLLVTVCTLRRDRLGAYGYEERPATPHLDELAAQSLVFDRAMSSSTWTVTSHASILTGRYGGHHQLLHEGHRLDPMPTLPGVLKHYGYRTVADIQEPAASSVGGGFGMVRDFDETLITKQHVNWKPDRVAEWMAQGEGPAMAFVHLREAHYPYGQGPPFVDKADARFKDWVEGTNAGGRYHNDGPDAYTRFLGALRADEGLRQNLNAVYDSGVLEADESIGELMAALRDRDLLDDTVVLIVSGHGEELGERGNLGHKASFDEHVVHLPMLVRLPNAAHGGTRIGQTVSHVDILPTFVDLAGGKAPAGTFGQSLAPLFEGQAIADQPALVQAANGSIQDLELWSLLALGDHRLDVRRNHADFYKVDATGRKSPQDRNADAEMYSTLQGHLDKVGAGGVGGEVRSFTPEEIEQLKRDGYW